MVKTLRCQNGHDWKVSDSVAGLEGGLACPLCGAPAETADNGDSSSLDARFDTQALDSTADRGDLREDFVDHDIVEKLGSGGMGVVYRAYDRKHRREVALKTLQRIDPQSLQRFKNEFRTLSDIAHPNLVTLYQMTSDGQSWFITMELIDGVEFSRYLNSSPKTLPANAEPQPGAIEVTRDISLPAKFSTPRLTAQHVTRLRAAFAQLVAGIAALHKAGVLHRDIKPSNVLVTAEGRVVLLDFGLAAEVGGSGSFDETQDAILGTIPYMSPEQAASRPISTASDWYAVGVMLYEALTGTLPFTGSPLKILQDKQQIEPPPPSDIADDVPEDLNEICVKLLQIRAEDRPTVAVIQNAFDDKARQSPGIGAELRSHDEVLLIGRETQLNAIEKAYGSMKKGCASAIFVHGKSGNGKTALVQKFLGAVNRRDSAVVLTGRCFERESVPFKAFDSLIDALGDYLRHCPERIVKELVPRDVDSLIRVFPVLRRIGAFACAPGRKTEINDEQELRRRAFVALRELLGRLGDRMSLVLFIDDLQWGDVDSGGLLFNLLQPPDPPVFLFLGSYRTDEAETSPFLQALQKQQEVQNQQITIHELLVEHLNHDDAIELALELLGPATPEAPRLAATIAMESAGNPFFLRELVNHLKLGGDPSLIKPGRLLDDVLWSRVQALPEDARRLLEFAAVIGEPIRQEDAFLALELASSGFAALNRLRSEHFVRTLHDGDKLDIVTYHDRIREAVKRRLAEDVIQGYHLQLAMVLESQGAIDLTTLAAYLDSDEDHFDAQAEESISRAFKIALQFDDGGDSARALPYALVAAQQARAQHALEVAEQQLRIAERGAAAAEPATRLRVAEGLGDVLMLQGKYQDAGRRFQDASGLAHDNVARANILGKVGELAFKQGDMKTAVESLEDALRLLGKKIPRSSVSLVLYLAWQLMLQMFHTLAPTLFLGRRSLDKSGNDLLKVRLLNRLAYAYWFARGGIPTVWAQTAQLNLVERYPPSSDLAQAYSTHAVLMSVVWWYKRGIAYAQKSLRIREASDDLWGLGQSLHFYGIVLYTASRFQECIEVCRKAVQLLERTGDFWEVNIARYQIAASLYRLGDLGGALEEAKRIHQSGLQLGDAQAEGISLDVWARASQGQIPEGAAEHAVKRLRHDGQGTAQTLLGEGVRLLLDKCDPQSAVDVFERGLTVARQKGVRNAYVTPLFSWSATALRQSIEGGKGLSKKEKRLLLRSAAWSAFWGRFWSVPFRNDRPHALRESALIAAIDGRSRRACRLIDKSLAVANHQGARYEFAKSLQARAQLRLDSGALNAGDELRDAERLLQEFDQVLQKDITIRD